MQPQLDQGNEKPQPNFTRRASEDEWAPTYPKNPGILVFFWDELFSAANCYQGIVGCTPTNVPLWEIPI